MWKLAKPKDPIEFYGEIVNGRALVEGQQRIGYRIIIRTTVKVMHTNTLIPVYVSYFDRSENRVMYEWWRRYNGLYKVWHRDLAQWRKNNPELGELQEKKKVLKTVYNTYLNVNHMPDTEQALNQWKKTNPELQNYNAKIQKYFEKYKQWILESDLTPIDSPHAPIKINAIKRDHHMYPNEVMKNIEPAAWIIWDFIRANPTIEMLPSMPKNMRDIILDDDEQNLPKRLMV